MHSLLVCAALLLIVVEVSLIGNAVWGVNSWLTTVEPLLYDHPQNHIGVVVFIYKRDGRSCGIRIQTECTVRHTKCGRMRGMVVGEGGRSSGVLLYSNKRPLLI